MPGTTQPPIVLVHGAWHGGWCWERVVPALQAAGHRVVAPTLTGLAERAGELTCETGLLTHIADICAVVQELDLHDVTLVGHSYAGMVITGVATALPERIGRLVYLDAFVPQAGDSAMTLFPPDRAAYYAATAAQAGEGWRIPPPPAAGLGVTAPEDAAWVESRMTDHPLLAFTQPLPQAAPSPATLPRRYIRCAAGSPSFAQVAARLSVDPAWDYRELTTGHDAMVTEPAALAALLLEP
ncbi:MAG: alpha/beta hydrolase family protein [Thermomicrobiales bacterium]